MNDKDAIFALVRLANKLDAGRDMLRDQHWVHGPQSEDEKCRQLADVVHESLKHE